MSVFILFVLDSNETWHFFFDSLPKNTEISSFMNIGQLEAELFHADGRTDRHDEAYTRNFANGPKNYYCLGRD